MESAGHIGRCWHWQQLLNFLTVSVLITPNPYCYLNYFNQFNLSAANIRENLSYNLWELLSSNLQVNNEIFHYYCQVTHNKRFRAHYEGTRTINRLFKLYVNLGCKWLLWKLYGQYGMRAVDEPVDRSN